MLWPTSSVVRSSVPPSVPQAKADFVTFDIKWSGSSLGNSATATGTVTFDTFLLPNPGDYFDSSAIPAFITSFTITVSGAGTGNGSFSLSDFKGLYWSRQEPKNAMHATARIARNIS